MILKICGITHPDDAEAAVAAGANALGFNFYPRSPRYIAPERAADIATPPGVLRVGVFVDEPPERVAAIAGATRLDVAQLHGKEKPEDFPGVRVWKAVRVGPGFDWTRIDGCSAEALLLDGPAGALYGGSGQAFDWARVAGHLQIRNPTRIILAGGLDESNVAQAVALVRPWGVDACSRIESVPGRKDYGRMSRFLAAAKAALCI